MGVVKIRLTCARVRNKKDPIDWGLETGRSLSFWKSRISNCTIFSLSMALRSYEATMFRDAKSFG